MDIAPLVTIAAAVVCLIIAFDRFAAGATDHYRQRWVARAKEFLERVDALGGPGTPGGEQVSIPEELNEDCLLHLCLPMQAMVMWSNVAADLAQAYQDTSDERLYDPDDEDVRRLHTAYLTARVRAAAARELFAAALERESIISARRALRAHSAMRRQYLHWRAKVQQLGPDEWFLLDLPHLLGAEESPASYAHRRLIDPQHRRMIADSAVAAILIAED